MKKRKKALLVFTGGKGSSRKSRNGMIRDSNHPYIRAGGGIVSNVQKPGTILLIEPEKSASIPQNTIHQYVSTQYVRDCIELNVQLDLESYRLHPEDKKPEVAVSEGRMPFTPEEDASILSYIRQHKAVDQVKGNQLWQEMGRAGVTSRTWQSMKARFRFYLADILSKKEEAEIAEQETKVDKTQETAIQNPSCEKEAAPPQTDSAALDLTQTDDQSIAAEGTKSENVEAQTSGSPLIEEQCVDPQMDVIPAESVQLETEEPQETITLKPMVEAEDASVSQTESPPDTSSQKKSKQKQTASPQPVQPQRRSTRRRLQLEEPTSPQPYGKKLRSSSTPKSPEQLKWSPLSNKKTQSEAKPADQKAATADQLPSKRARGEGVAAVSENGRESGQDSCTEKSNADEESNSVAQKGGKTKGKRKLGILELATKEFEDESESDQEETIDVETFAEMETTESMLPETLMPTSDAEEASLHSGPEPGAIPQENGLEPQASTGNQLTETSCPDPAAAELQPTSKAHLFIFDSESQEASSQNVVVDGAAAPSNLQLNEDAGPSLTLLQLEEDKQQIRELMNQTNQDLVCVTKALLKTSGDFSAALRLLLNPSSFPGPFWNSHDDSLLLSDDPAVRQQLQQKYGEQDVAKRIMFLEVEG
ncbi:hypothetical protein LDENG_00112590 [Lucifuga dentata]|nr:hypothetical protein LDENG_00112590 [Lucifuga dentata]